MSSNFGISMPTNYKSITKIENVIILLKNISIFYFHKCNMISNSTYTALRKSTCENSYLASDGYMQQKPHQFEEKKIKKKRTMKIFMKEM